MGFLCQATHKATIRATIRATTTPAPISRLRHMAAAAAALLALVAPPLVAPAQALTFDEALALGLRNAPVLAARAAAAEGTAQGSAAAGQLPDPELRVGIENLPVSGPEAGSLVRDGMTMRRLGWMQSVPNAAKRQAQQEGARARTAQQRSLEAVERLKVQREIALAWLRWHFAQRQQTLFTTLQSEHHLLASTAAARVASGKALPAEVTMVQLEGLQLGERHDELALQSAQGEAALRRWIGAEAMSPPSGEPPPWARELAADDRSALATDHAQHPQITAFDAETAAAEADLHEARAATRGDWSWEVAYGKRAAQYGDMVSVQLSFELPVSPATRQRPLIAQRGKDLDRVAADRADALRRLEAQALAQQAEIVRAQRAWRRQREQVMPLVQERVRLQTASYEAGRVDLGAVLAARHDAAEAALRTLELEARLAMAQAGLRYLVLE